MTEIEGCQNALNSAGLQNCFQNLQNYVGTHGRIERTGDQSGYTVPLAQYSREMEERERQLGGASGGRVHLVTLPEPFQNGLTANWQEDVRRLGGTFVEYHSWSVANPPVGSRARILIHLPGPYSDQWIQVTVPEGRSADLSRQGLINVIGVEKADPPGVSSPRNCPAPCTPPRFSVAEYSFDGNVDGRRGQGGRPFPHGHPANSPSYSCYSCHPSGARQIVPAPGSVPANQLATLNRMNNAMTYRNQAQANYYRIDMNSFGPHRGTTHCAGCHGFGGGMARQGALTTATSSGTIEHKMLVEFSMPPRLENDRRFRPFFTARDRVEQLNDSERAELMRRYSSASPAQYNQIVLQFLRDKAKIDVDEHRAASAALTALAASQRERFDRFQAENNSEGSRHRLRTWLLGGAEHCVSTPPEPILRLGAEDIRGRR